MWELFQTIMGNSAASGEQQQMLAAQNAEFGNWGLDATNQALGGGTYGSMDALKKGAGGSGLAGIFGDNSFMGDAFGKGGWVSPVLQGIGSLAQSWAAMKQLDLAKDQFSFQKDAFNKNWAAQTSTLNTAMADRQAARVGSAGTLTNKYQSVGDYMDENRIA